MTEITFMLDIEIFYALTESEKYLHTQVANPT